MSLIDRLPIPGTEHFLSLPTGQQIAIKAWQPVVWIAVTPPQVLELPTEVRWFPAVLDTGFNQTLLLQGTHLQDWGGIRPDTLQTFPGERIAYGNQSWSFRIADIWLRPNLPGQDLPRHDIAPVCLETHPGIIVVSPRERKQRLPVLGLRALARNNATIHIDFPQLLSGWLSIDVPGVA